MATKTYVDIHGRNKTDRAFNKVQGNVSKLDNSFKKLNGGIAAFGTGLALLKLISLGNNAIDSADKIDKLSTRLGASSEALSQYRHVASQAEIEFDTLTMGWQRMTRRVAEAAQGTGEAKGALIELGISAKALNKLAPEDQFEVLAEALHKVEAPADRVRLSMKLFDSEGVSLIQTMKGGAAGIREMREEADQLGLTLTESQTRGAADAKDAIDRLTSSMSGAFSQAVLDNIGFIETFTEVIANIKPIALGMVGEVMAGFEHIKSAAMIAGEGLKLAFIAPIAFITDAFGEMVTKFGKFSSIFGENDISIAIKDFGASVEDTLNPIDDFNEKVRQIGIEKEKAIAATRTLAMEMMDEAGAAKVVTSEVLKAGNAVSEFEFKTKKGTAALEENKNALKEQQKALKAAADEVKRLAKATGTDLIKSQDQLNRTIDESIEYTKNYSKALETAREVLLSRGLIEGTKEYENALKSLGFETEKVTTVMSEHWERFADGAFDSFKTFTQSAFTDFKSFGSDLKNLAKDLVADLIATFASDKLKNIISSLFGGGPSASAAGGGGILDTITGLFGGGGSTGGSGGGGLGGLGSIGGIFKGLFGGTTSAVGPVQPGVISGLFASGGIFSATGSVGSLFAPSGLFGSSGAIAGSFSNLTTLINPYTAAIAAVVALGGPLIGKIFKSGARSPQQLGEDQLAAVDKATKEGRNTQVGLGQAGSTALSFLGGFDENSIFFGVDLAKEQLQKVGDVFREMTGANQALALKDGVIRIEDFNRKFSENNDTIVAQLKASIIQVELGITESEKSIIASIGGNLTELDRLFDASAGNGETAAQRLAAAYSEATNSNIQAGQDWVNSAGIDADRIAQIFGASSAEVTAALFGVSSAGQEVFDGLVAGTEQFATNIQGLNGILNTVDLGVAQGQINIPQITPSPSNVVPINAGQNGQSGNQGLSPDAQAIVAEMKQQTAELREARLKPSGR